VAKKINEIIKPYLSTKHSIESTDELLLILKSTKPTGILASLDVENLFTNVPIDTTIKIILNQVYRNPNSLPPPTVPESIMESMLAICTKEAPFRHIDGTLYRQTDGIAMGSPLGPTFANAYMANLEEKVLSSCDFKPSIYLRYVDDIFVVAKDETELEALRVSLENESVLKFTREIGNNKLPFLDVDITVNNDRIETSVYVKRTNSGECLNFNSQCPDKYKRGVVFTLINRAYKICSDWEKFNQEVTRLKQVLTNNNYPMELVENEINRVVTKKLKTEKLKDNESTINLYYKNQMNSNYKMDEKVLQDLLKTKVKCVNDRDKIKLNIYYKNTKTSNFLIKNNISSSLDPLRQSNVVYKLSCPVEDCKLSNPSYIGSTRCTLAQRITNHVQSGSYRSHLVNEHDMAAARGHFTNNVSVIRRLPDKTRLFIYEALCIKSLRPSINGQSENMQGFLKLFNNIPANEAGEPRNAILIRTPHTVNNTSSTLPAPRSNTYNLRRR
jgi:hypothetical protein